MVNTVSAIGSFSGQTPSVVSASSKKSAADRLTADNGLTKKSDSTSSPDPDKTPQLTGGSENHASSSGSRRNLNGSSQIYYFTNLQEVLGTSSRDSRSAVKLLDNKPKGVQQTSSNSNSKVSDSGCSSSSAGSVYFDAHEELPNDSIIQNSKLSDTSYLSSNSHDDSSNIFPGTVTENESVSDDSKKHQSIIQTPASNNSLKDRWNKLPLPAKRAIKTVCVVGGVAAGLALIVANPVLGIVAAAAGLYFAFKHFNNESGNSVDTQTQSSIVGQTPIKGEDKKY